MSTRPKRSHPERDPPGWMGPLMHSQRTAVRIAALFAIVLTDADGIETIAVRETPTGTQPWLLDDPELALVALNHVQLTRDPKAALVTFVRHSP